MPLRVPRLPCGLFPATARNTATCPSFSVGLPRASFRAPLTLLERYFWGSNLNLAAPKQCYSNLFLLFSGYHRLKPHDFGMAAEAELGEQCSRAPEIDLLSRFGVEGCRDAELTDRVSKEEVELGLSLGGCFEAEPEMNRSIWGLSMYDDEGIVQPIVKICSQPKESEELRKRKAVQSLKRLEAKQRRIEKRESRTGANHDHGAVDGLSRLRSVSQRSVVSQGSSGLSDFDCRLEHGILCSKGSSNCKEVKPLPLSIPLFLKHANIIIPIKDKQSKKMFNEANLMISVEEDKESKKKFEIEDKAKELDRSKMEEKPCVSAQGDGPNGRMIQGLLYKYGSWMDVRIVCVCHGSFLTPAEFVKHAGGDDVAHPLRHIFVSRPPFSF